MKSFSWKAWLRFTKNIYDRQINRKSAQLFNEQFYVTLAQWEIYKCGMYHCVIVQKYKVIKICQNSRFIRHQFQVQVKFITPN